MEYIAVLRINESRSKQYILAIKNKIHLNGRNRIIIEISKTIITLPNLNKVKFDLKFGKAARSNYIMWE